MEKTEGWEIILSYAFNTGLTTGFVKGTSESRIPEAIERLQKCAAQSHHPMLLPLLLLSEHLGSGRDQQLRDTRDWVRRLEASISRRVEHPDEKVEESMADVEEINRALAECHAQVLRKRPQDWLELIEGMTRAMDLFRSHSSEEVFDKAVEKTHNSICGRLEFYKTKLRGIEGYATTTLERLRIQRDAVSRNARMSQPIPIAIPGFLMSSIARKRYVASGEHHQPSDGGHDNGSASDRRSKQEGWQRIEAALDARRSLHPGNFHCFPIQHGVLYHSIRFVHSEKDNGLTDR